MQSTVSSIKEGIWSFCHLSLRDKWTNIESYRDGESVSADSALGLGGHRRAQEREGLKVESQPADICKQILNLDCLNLRERAWPRGVKFIGTVWIKLNGVEHLQCMQGAFGKSIESIN